MAAGKDGVLGSAVLLALFALVTQTKFEEALENLRTYSKVAAVAAVVLLGIWFLRRRRRPNSSGGTKMTGPEIAMALGAAILLGGLVWSYFSDDASNTVSNDSKSARPADTAASEAVNSEVREQHPTASADAVKASPRSPSADVLIAKLQVLRETRDRLSSVTGEQNIDGKQLTLEDHWLYISNLHLNFRPEPDDELDSVKGLNWTSEPFIQRCRKVQEIARKELGIDVDEMRPTERLGAAPRESLISNRHAQDSYRGLYWEYSFTEKVLAAMSPRFAEIPRLEVQIRTMANE